MTDWQPLWATLMTQCQGTSTIHETIMDKRFQYVPNLQKMGATIEYFQPNISHMEVEYNFNNSDEENLQHAIEITGPTQLMPIEATIEDLRQGASLILAAMSASGISTIHNTQQVDRGYEHLDRRLNSMGAKIKRI